MRVAAAIETIDDAIDDDWWADDGDFIGGLWNRYGGTRDNTDTAARTANALRLVQGFVDTFATGDAGYRVTFDPAVGTAGTDYGARKIVVSHAPLFDRTIDAAMAETVLTAMAAHEASHVRYGRATAAAVRKELARYAVAARVSNILDDVRIERRFVADYPGYAHIFAPAIRYVAESQLRKTGDAIFSAARLDDLGRMVGAVRYPAHVDWTGHDDVRDWWTAWAERGVRTDSPKDHVAAVREAIARRMVVFPWRRGDVLAIDNYAVSHGRLPYSGAREIAVAWA